MSKGRSSSSSGNPSGSGLVVRLPTGIIQCHVCEGVGAARAERPCSSLAWWQLAGMGWLCLKLTSVSGTWSASRAPSHGLTAKRLNDEGRGSPPCSLEPSEVAVWVLRLELRLNMLSMYYCQIHVLWQ